MSTSGNLVIEQRFTDSLIPYARNSRTHSEAQIAQIAGSIREFGFVNPVLIDEEGGIIAGHGRVMAAIKLGMTEVPCIVLSHLTKAQQRALLIADNKIAINAGWNEEMLALELGELHEAEFDVSVLGFGETELESLLGLGEETPGADDDGIRYQEKYAVLIECANEKHQQEIFSRMVEAGYTCKVLVN